MESAKQLADYFLLRTEQKATAPIYSRLMRNITDMQSSNYTLDEMKQVIDYVLDVKRIELYSFGYISVSINNILREIKKAESKVLSNLLKEEIAASHQNIDRPEVTTNDQSAERNRAKLHRFGNESRLREKPNFNMPPQ